MVELYAEKPDKWSERSPQSLICIRFHAIVFLNLPEMSFSFEVGNASHTSDAIEAKIPEWQDKNLEVFYLPKYFPRLNFIEILWRFMKYEWIQ